MQIEIVLHTSLFYAQWMPIAFATMVVFDIIGIAAMMNYIMDPWGLYR